MFLNKFMIRLDSDKRKTEFQTLSASINAKTGLMFAIAGSTEKVPQYFVL